MGGNGSSSRTGGGIFGLARGLEDDFVGVVKGFARALGESRAGMGNGARPELSVRCFPALFLTGENGLEVMAGPSVFTARDLDWAVDKRAEADVDGRDWACGLPRGGVFGSAERVCCVCFASFL